MASSDVASGSGAPVRAPRIWWTRRALVLHLVVVIVVPAFLALFWWQVQRVREGNTLSWAYVFEWPIFTGYAIYLWWKLVHDQLDCGRPVAGRNAVRAGGQRGYGGDRSAAPAAPTAPAATAIAASTDHRPRENGAEEEDEELAAYNRYLAELNSSGRRKRW